MNGTMRKYNILKTALGFLALLLAHQGMAQQNTYQSVLGQHTWYRLSIAREGVYKLDYATFQAMGVDMNALKPNQIRLFGNPSGALPEKNSEARYDDLTEMALYVEGADDGVFGKVVVIFKETVDIADLFFISHVYIEQDDLVSLGAQSLGYL